MTHRHLLLSCSPQPVRSFFRANAATCREWLLRARRHLLRAPAALGRLPPAAALTAVAPLLGAGRSWPPGALSAAVLAAAAAGSVQLVRGLRQLEPDSDHEWMAAAELLAAGRHGQAADQLRGYLEQRLPAPADPELLALLGGRALHGYLAVGRYEEAVRWRQTMDDHQLAAHEPAGDSLDNIRLLASFADGDYGGVSALAAAERSSTDRLSSALDCQLEVAVAAAALCTGGERGTAADTGQRLTEAARRAARLVHDGATEYPPRVAPTALLSLQSLHQLVAVREGAAATELRLPELAEPGWRARRLDTAALLQLTYWSQCLETLHVIAPSDPGAARLRLTAVKRLRRVGEAAPAARLLLRLPSTAAAEPAELTARLQRLVTEPSEAAPLPETRREAAKLLHQLAEPAAAVEALLDTPAADVTSGTDVLLARWLGGGAVGATPGPARLERYLSTVPAGDLGGVDSQVVPAADLIIGRLLEAAVQRCPEHAKAWFLLADWCYTWGKQAVAEWQSRSADQLTRASRAAVAALLPAGQPQLVDRVTDIVERSHVPADSGDHDNDDDIEVSRGRAAGGGGD